MRRLSVVVAVLGAMLVGGAASAQEGEPPGEGVEPPAAAPTVVAPVPPPPPIVPVEPAPTVAAVVEPPAAPAPVDLRLSGYVQADAVVHAQDSVDELDPSTRQPLNQDRVLVRRARVRAEARRGPWSGSLELDGNTVNGASAKLISAEVTLAWPGDAAAPLVAGTLGLFKVPFGAEVPERTPLRLFLEPSSAARAFFPGDYDLGLRVQGAWRFVRWSVAAVDGQPAGAAFLPARDPDGAKDLVGRVGVDLEAGGGVRVVAGVSLLSGQGFHAGHAASKDELVWRDVNEDGRVQPTELQVIEGQAAEPSVSFDRFALGGDVEIVVPVPRGRVVLRGEASTAENLDRGLEPADPVAAGRDLRESGWLASLTGELGPATLGLRYDVYDPDADASAPQGATLVPVDRRYRTLAVVAAWRLGIGRLALEYDHIGNALGVDASGAPTTLAQDRVTLRAQVEF